MNRRGFLAGLLAAPVAAVAIRLRLAPSLPVMGDVNVALADASCWQQFGSLSEEMAYIVRRAFTAKLVATLYDSSPLVRQLMANSTA